ncbi:OmpA family protein [Croceicoccus mobilis]|uniref:OmpA-like domain-containing protein n=1 Tax=Croceicoccus mobilis TaxID=1703339 RepID=A0A916Z2J0_9SPHN|nr:OmpA family protein [Croceicoccus mobilis]GGD73729.1 hypothetical protein GCM10010990_24160 [Croceicoccus mobilis]
MTIHSIRSMAAAGGASLALACALASPAAAQEVTTVMPGDGNLMQLSDSELKSELERRYEVSLAATEDPAIVNALDARYHWASEAKVQCAIARGFMKNGLRDEDSIRKCQGAYGRLTGTPPTTPMAPPPPPPPPAPPEVCNQPTNQVFFDFDSATAPANTMSTAQFLLKNAPMCGWSGYEIVGHTDRSGSDAYNEALSIARADAVTEVMVAAGADRAAIISRGVGETDLAVPTVDGERNPQNRRVVITVR